MPKKNPTVSLPDEEFLREASVPLSLEERAALRAFFVSDLWKKVWKNALIQYPSCVVSEANPTLTGILANNQMHRQQGWKKLRDALASQVEAQIPRAPRPADNFPNPLEIEPR